MCCRCCARAGSDQPLCDGGKYLLLASALRISFPMVQRHGSICRNLLQPERRRRRPGTRSPSSRLQVNDFFKPAARKRPCLAVPASFNRCRRRAAIQLSACRERKRPCLAVPASCNRCWRPASYLLQGDRRPRRPASQRFHGSASSRSPRPCRARRARESPTQRLRTLPSRPSPPGASSASGVSESARERGTVAPSFTTRSHGGRRPPLRPGSQRSVSARLNGHVPPPGDAPSQTDAKARVPSSGCGHIPCGCLAPAQTAATASDAEPPPAMPANRPQFVSAFESKPTAACPRPPPPVAAAAACAVRCRRRRRARGLASGAAGNRRNRRLRPSRANPQSTAGDLGRRFAPLSGCPASPRYPAGDSARRTTLQGWRLGAAGAELCGDFEF